MNRCRFSLESRLSGAMALWVGLALGGSISLPAQEVTTQPTAGFRAEILSDLARLEQKLVGLAEAIPEEEFGWRPVETVRTLGEVFRHVAATNLHILQSMGIENSADPNPTAELASKEEIIEALRSSIDAVRQAVSGSSDADLDSQAQFLGRDWSQRSLFYLSATHMHEHLGQAVAYARSVGVVPPWSQHLGDDG